VSFVPNTSAQRGEQSGITKSSQQLPPVENFDPSLMDLWDKLVRRFNDAKIVDEVDLGRMAEMQLVGRSNTSSPGVPEIWNMRIDSAVDATKLSDPDSVSRKAIENALALQSEIGHSVQLQVTVGSVVDSPKLRRATADQARLKTATEILEADPYIQELKRDFGATIVPSSVKPL
jgi:hypothetical protein